MNRVRQGAVWIYRILITLFAAAVAMEIFLAGLGIFRAMPGEDESVSHETIEDKFDAHAALGDFLGGGSLLLLIVILVAWTGRRSIGATFALAVLTVVQGILGGTGDSAPIAGAFHVVNAILILGLAMFLAMRAWRGNLLIPPELRGAAPPPPPAPWWARRSSRSPHWTSSPLPRAGCHGIDGPMRSVAGLSADADGVDERYTSESRSVVPIRPAWPPASP